ncbi:O-acetyl-ADP-ribose deacetylase [archaeon HR06]|nr:O-acetyl-ADP-ribose deacetylase [archaeon HR06]
MGLEINLGRAKIKIIRGDITEQEVDALVNSANPSLMGGGGVDGAIHKKGGVKILEECKKIRETMYPNGLPTGEAVITSGGNLKAKFVIHTVGPIWQGGSKGEDKLLERAYLSSLKLAKDKGLTSLAFPSISTGAYGFPIERASKIALRTVKEFLIREDGLEEVVFVLFNERDKRVYEEVAKDIFQ